MGTPGRVCFDAYALEHVKLKRLKRSFYERGEEWLEKSTLPQSPLRRFLSLMHRMNAVSYLKEPIALNEELVYEKQAIAYRVKVADVKLTATRVTFFSTMPGDPDNWLDTKALPDDAILGYAILANLELPNGTQRIYILESVVREPSQIGVSDGRQEAVTHPRIGYYIHCKRGHVARIGRAGEGNHRHIPLIGSFFAQQNDLTHVCAHAAIRMAINSSDVFRGKKLTNAMIDEYLGINWQTGGRDIGHYEEESTHVNGLYTDELGTIVDKMGGDTVTVEFCNYTEVEYDHYVYPFMESGYPVLVGLGGIDSTSWRPIRHVVTVLGHTLNADRWTPEAREGYGIVPLLQYLPTAEWADHFIINDDGYGMYLTLQADVVRNLLVPSKNLSLHAMFAMGITPRGISLSGVTAEEVVSQKLDQLFEDLAGADPQHYWYRTLRRSKRVYRTLVQSRDAYMRHILEIKKDLPEEHKQRLMRLPDRFWVSELSVPALYAANTKKVGDAITLTDPDRRNRQAVLDSVVMMWVPGFVRYGNETPMKWQITDPVPLLASEV